MLKRKLLALTLIVFFMAGCAGGQMFKKDATPSERYLAALTEFNETVKNYLDQYNLQSPAVQANWKEEIDPWIKRVSVALDAWGEAIDDKAQTADKIRAFENLKDVLISTLVSEGVKLIKKGGN